MSSKGVLQECHLSVSTQGVSQVGSLENVRNKCCLCSSTYVSAFGFVGFILFPIAFVILALRWTFSSSTTTDKVQRCFLVIFCCQRYSTKLVSWVNIRSCRPSWGINWSLFTSTLFTSLFPDDRHHWWQRRVLAAATAAVLIQVKFKGLSCPICRSHHQRWGSRRCSSCSRSWSWPKGEGAWAPCSTCSAWTWRARGVMLRPTKRSIPFFSKFLSIIPYLSTFSPLQNSKFFISEPRSELSLHPFSTATAIWHSAMLWILHHLHIWRDLLKVWGNFTPIADWIFLFSTNHSKVHRSLNSLSALLRHTCLAVPIRCPRARQWLMHWLRSTSHRSRHGLTHWLHSRWRLLSRCRWVQLSRRSIWGTPN